MSPTTAIPIISVELRPKFREFLVTRRRRDGRYRRLSTAAQKEQGLFAVPDIGAGVWIEFEGGDLSYPIWSGTWFTSGHIPESAKAGKKVFKTKSGHKIVLDDDGGRLEITDSNGNSVTMDSSTVKIAAGGAVKVVIDAPQIELVDSAAHPLVFGDELMQYLNQIVQLFNSHMHPGEPDPQVLSLPSRRRRLFPRRRRACCLPK